MKQTLWSKYGAHLLAYLMGLLTIVLSYVHGCAEPLGPQAARYIGVAGIILTALHHIQTYLNSSAPLPAPLPSARREGGRVHLRLLGAICGMAAAILVGCAALTSATTSAASASAVQAAIDLAVGTTLQTTAKTPAQQAAKAAKIVLIAQTIEGVVTGNSSTLATLDAALQVAIVKANLAPPDKAAAMILAQTVQSIILQQIQGAPGAPSALTPTQTVAVKTVLNDVIQAASFYNVHAMAAMRADLAQRSQ